MRKFLILSAVTSMLLAQTNTVLATLDSIKNYEQIVDIRTPSEWRESGIIDGAKTITFDPRDVNGFLNELLKQVDTKKPIALICRSGGRSATAAKLIDSAGLNIINLDGGMSNLIKQGYITIPYDK